MYFTSLHCRWQTRATRCLTPTVLYTDIDGQCDTLMTDDCHQIITLTIHLSRQHLRRSTCSYEIFKVQSLGESPRGNYPYFCNYPNSLQTQYRTNRRKPLCEKSPTCSTVFVQCRLVTETGWFGVVRSQPRSLKIAPFDRAHMNYN